MAFAGLLVSASTSSGMALFSFNPIGKRHSLLFTRAQVTAIRLRFTCSLKEDLWEFAFNIDNHRALQANPSYR